MKRILRGAATSIGVAGRAFVALIGICGVVAALANYTMTQGAGTTFGSVIVGGFHYVQFMICDLTTPAQCAAVSAAGAVKVDGSAVTQPVSAASLPLPAGAATSANQTTEIAAINAPAPVIAGTLPSTQTPVATGATTKLQSDLNGNIYANPVSQYPAGSVAITASATGTTAATTATLAGTAGKTTYICSYSIRANATAAVTVTNTITGVITGTLSHIMWIAPAASGLGIDEQIFMPCVPASAANTGIAVVSGAPGTGGLVSSTATGYQL